MKSESLCRQKYQNEVECQLDPFQKWIERNEEQYKLDLKNSLTYRIVFMEECAGNWDVTKYDEDIVIMYSMKGELAENAVNCILDYFSNHKDVTLLYADEDILISEDDLQNGKNKNILWQVGLDPEHLPDNKNGRAAPWFKPDFSKDTLLSFQYFGNIVAVQTSRVRRANIEIATTAESHYNLYDFYLKLSEKAEIGHLSKILFHRHGFPGTTLPSGTRKKYNTLKEEALRRRGLSAQFVTDKEGYTHIKYTTEYHPFVSVLIPTKDHPDLLKKCIESMKFHTKYTRYEIIVIDNGSAEANKEKILALKDTFEFTYIYEKMDFNFSKMCNMAASKAKGELLLFLNDDIEINQEDWMDIMVGQAMLSHVGVVGVKLLYPKDNLIQHAGVSNLAVGPVHRLHGYSDENSMYYGRNRMTYNVLAVTAAAIMMRKSVFDQVDGFCEELKVAYNDVDLCMRVYEAGFVNVIRNDVSLIHHESVSRGSDLNGEKRYRLDQERALLYGFHEQFAPSKETSSKDMEAKVMDPYCHNTEYWKRNSLFQVGYLFDYENPNLYTQAKKILTRNYRNNEEGVVIPKKVLSNPGIRFFDRTQVMISIDKNMEHSDFIEIEGWALVTKNDNALFRKHMLLKDESNQIYAVEPFIVLREDVAQNIEGQINVLLSGFVLRIKKEDLPSGKFKIGALFQSQVKKKHYVGYSEEYILID